MDVKRVLADAWEAVEAAGLPEHVHGVAFEQAVALTVGHRTKHPLTPPHVDEKKDSAGSSGRSSRKQPTGNGVASAAETPAPTYDEDTFFATLASESGVEEDRLRKVYYLKDGRPRIALTKSKLGSTEAARNRAVATLLAGIRWFVDGKQSVLIGEVRDAAEAIPYEVSRNLASHLNKVEGTMTVGAKNDKAVRVKTDKFGEPYGALIETLTSA